MESSVWARRRIFIDHSPGAGREAMGVRAEPARDLPGALAAGTLDHVQNVAPSRLPGVSSVRRKVFLMNRVRWRKRLIPAVKVVVAVVVAWGVGRHVLRTWRDLGRHELDLEVSPAFLTLAGLLYLVGLVLCGLFYDDLLKATSTPIPRLAAVRAYLISHLGKYVPGKGMVRGDAGGDVGVAGRARGDGCDRDVLRDAGDDGGRRPDRGVGLRDRGGRRRY